MAELTGLNVRITGNATDLVAAANRATAALSGISKVTKKTETAVQKSAAANARLAASYKRVKTTIDPTFAATQQYDKALLTLNKAYKSGIISQGQLSTAVKQAQVNYKVAGASITTFNTQIRTSRFHTANLAAQFNDIGVMLASGQSPLILAVQQGTQITQVLQTMGGTAKQQLGALKQAFLAIVSPTALIVIGLIAGGVALARWAFNAFTAESATDSLTTATELLDAALSGASDATGILELNIDELTKKFGEGAARARDMAREILEIRRANLEGELSELSTVTNDAVNQFEKLTDVYGILTGETPLFADQTGRATSLLKQFSTVMGVSEGQGLKLAGAFVDIKNAQGDFLAEQTAMIGLSSTLEEMGVSAGELPKSFREAILTADKLGLTLLEIQATLARGDAAGEAPAGPGGSGGGSGSREKAERDAARLEEERKRADESLLLELERINEGNATKLEMEEKFHEERLAIIDEAGQRRLITEEEWNAASEAESERYQNAVTRIDRVAQASRLSALSGVLGLAASALAQGNKKMLAISKAFGIAQGLIDAYGAYLKALNDPTIPSTIARMALALTVLGLALRAVSSIKGVSAGGGGGSGAGGAAANAGQVAPAEAASPTTAVNINLRGQSFDRGAVIGLIEQINEAVGDGARIRAT